MSLLEFKKNVYSQNGEDGILEKIFKIIGTTNKFCCEFGAWDGKHFSNTHALIKEKGWGGIQIEADEAKYKDLLKTYKSNNKVIAVNVLIGTGKNSLESIFKQNECPTEYDLLSVDIDGLDYYVLQNLRLKPRVICIEVNAGHSPNVKKLLPRDVAKNNVGQPLAVFCETASRKGYRLIGYNGNAFFLNESVGFEEELPTLPPRIAYRRFLANLGKQQRVHLYGVNRSWVPPYHRYRNRYLTAANLRLSPNEIINAYSTHKKLHRYRREIGEIK